MKEFIMSLMCAGVASGIIGLFFEDDGELGKYVKLVMSLCIAAMMIPGASELFGGISEEWEEQSLQLPELESIRQSYDGYIIEKARLSMCDEMKTLIFDKTGIMPHNVNIQFSVDEKDGRIAVEVASVTVGIPVEAEEIVKSVAEYVYDLVGCVPEIEVIGA